MKCDCDDWKENASIVDSALVLYVLRGNEGIEKGGKYCLWCGKKLKKEKNDN